MDGPLVMMHAIVMSRYLCDRYQKVKLSNKNCQSVSTRTHHCGYAGSIQPVLQYCAVSTHVHRFDAVVWPPTCHCALYDLIGKYQSAIFVPLFYNGTFPWKLPTGNKVMSALRNLLKRFAPNNMDPEKRCVY